MSFGLISMVITFVVCLAIGVPMLATLGMATLIPMIIESSIPLTMIPQVMYTGVDQFPIIAVTGFILAGLLMADTGITDSIIEFASSIVGNFTGGLANITILSSMFFASLSGSGPATTAAVGSIMYPAMHRQNYTPQFSAGIIAVGGVLGILIPPSNPMIMYAIIANLSVTKMFMAGIIPGIFVGLLLMLAVYIVSKKKNFEGSGELFSIRRFINAMLNGKWALISPVIILGGIYGGIFTPTEAAEVAVIYSIFVGFVITKKLTLKKLYKSLAAAAVLSGTVIVIVGVAVAFGRLLTLYRIPQFLAEQISSISTNPIIIMLLISLLLIIVGTFMETLAQVIIFTPIFVPLLEKLSIDPIHFGVLFILCCEVGFLTPPLGANLYIATKISNVPIEHIFVAILPFIITLILAILSIIFIPQISLILPALLMR